MDVATNLRGPLGLGKWASIFVIVWFSLAPSKVMLLKHDAGDFVPDTSFDISASLEYVSGLVHASLAKVVRCVSLSVAPEETIPHHVPQSSIGKSSCRF
ncbi:hypothetical protein Tco_0860405 [Tanacetum coccineum]|uniref:Uncharacterized protein n=1 Tax=Tanacetum coccineum TaxID=301880 RepID=A0ABQ5BHT6_9ASTR